MAKSKILRVSSKKDPQVGPQRHDLYEAAFTAYNDAMKHHYFLDAVGLIGSLIEDRLESLLNELDPDGDKSLKPLGTLIQRLNKMNIESFNKVLSEINSWKDKRNDAIHQLAKLLDPEFNKHYASLKKTAEEGFRNFRDLDKQYKAYMRAKNREN